MIRFSHGPALLLAVGLSACGSPHAPPPASAAPPAAPGDAVRDAVREPLPLLVERYWQEAQPAQTLRDDAGEPLTIAPQALADELALERRYLNDLLAVKRAGLSDEAGLTYDLFRRGRELRIEGYVYPQELLPLDGFDGMPVQFARMAAGSGGMRFVTVADYDEWLRRCAQFGDWVRQAIANMREGLRRGYVIPAVVVRRELPLLEELGRDQADTVFYRAAAALPKSLGDAERARLGAALEGAVKNTVLPAYRELYAFLQSEYLPRARSSVGLAALPLGERWYAFLIRRSTGSTLGPGEIHALGVSEVEKLHARLQAVLLEVGYTGTASAYLSAGAQDGRLEYRTPEELVAAYQELKSRIGASAATLFSLQPTADFDIRAAAATATATATATLGLRGAPLWYRPADVSGGDRGVLFVGATGINDRPVAVDIPAFLREAVPGRQYQIELQAERKDLPHFRRGGRWYAFDEAWAEYAASLGEELGAYGEAQARAEWLAQQLRCAASLVVDTGLHAQGWTRQQALDYWQAQVPSSDEARGAAIDRMIGAPARALACELGLLELRALRAHAEQALGARFDPRAFHAAILEDGAMPLDLLDAKLKRWLTTVP